MKSSESRVLAQHDVLVSSDAGYQRRLRLLQSLWRVESGLEPGLHKDEPLGSSLSMPHAQETLANYLTPAIRALVRHEVEGSKSEGKLYGAPRIYNNLLSSQPLCFNLFGELALDLDLASAVLGQIWPEEVGQVTAIEFEWSPGRGDERYLDNNSAFDVVVFHTTPEGAQGFIGIEVKYHENMRVGAANHKDRYDAVAESSGVFVDHSVAALRHPPLQQVWLDHMLGLSMLEHDEWNVGKFVVLYPSINTRCAGVVDDYSRQVDDDSTFEGLHMETLVAAIGEHSDAAWVRAFHDRYLDYAKAEGALSQGG